MPSTAAVALAAVHTRQPGAPPACRHSHGMRSGATSCRLLCSSLLLRIRRCGAHCDCCVSCEECGRVLLHLRHKLLHVAAVLVRQVVAAQGTSRAEVRPAGTWPNHPDGRCAATQAACPSHSHSEAASSCFSTRHGRARCHGADAGSVQATPRCHGHLGSASSTLTKMSVMV